MTAAERALADPASLHADLVRLRSSGAWRVDPTRFGYLEALSRRLDAQPPPVRELLQDRLRAALADYAARVSRRQQQVDEAAAHLLAQEPRQAAQVRRLQAACDLAGLHRLAQPREPGPTPLTRLVQSIRSPAGQGPQELASVRRFRQAWDRQRTLERVEQALARKPANAGPLNSHALVVQALERMRALSPEYLRHFVSYVETLQALEQATAKPAPKKPARPAARSRRS